MFKKYCTNCDNLYDLSKTIPTLTQSRLGQKGGEISDTPDTVSSMTDSPIVLGIDEIITKLLAGEDVDKKDIGIITLTQLAKNSSYKKLQGKDKETVYNKISELLPGKKSDIAEEKDSRSSSVLQAYFLCKNCGNYESIKPGTIVVRRVADELHNSYEFEDTAKYKDMLNVQFIPRTRRYNCPNNQCKSHKDHSQREAVFFRQSNSYRVRYVCSSCYASWTS